MFVIIRGIVEMCMLCVISFVGKVVVRVTIQHRWLCRKLPIAVVPSAAWLGLGAGADNSTIINLERFGICGDQQ